MEIVTIHTAKTTLSQLLIRSKRGRKSCWRAASSLSPNSCHYPVAPRRQFGAMREVVSVNPEFFDPLPDDELAAWEQ